MTEARADRQTWGAPERNKGPILQVLKRLLASSGEALEIASGSGQHAVAFTEALPDWLWQPTDVDEANLRSIRGWVSTVEHANLRLPLTLDVCSPEWPVGTVDLVYCANMIHITPWACTEALIRGASRHLSEGGQLITYGPYRIGGVETAASNEAFDVSLRARDSRWGLREVESLVDVGHSVGLRLAERVPMPANNQILVFRRE